MSQQQPTLFSFFKKASTPNSKCENPNKKFKGLSPVKDFKSLDLVWAKLEGYPWWPALIYEHPVEKIIRKNKCIHVQFFDDPPTRGWVKNAFVKYYGTPESCGINSYKDPLWLKAKGEADEAQSLSTDERFALIVPMVPSDEDNESSFNSSNESKENVDSNIGSNGKRMSNDSKNDIPESKRRRILLVSDEGSSEDEYKPVEDEDDDDSASSGVDENLVSDIDPETESEAGSPVKKMPRPKMKPASSKSSKSNVSFTPKSNFSPCSTPSSPNVSSVTKSKLSLFSANVTPTKTKNENGDWPHMKLTWLFPANIKDKYMRSPTDPDYDPRTLYVPQDFLSKQTPSMRQWWEMKKDHFDIVLFFKMGKFYELFHMDAILSIQELGLLMMKGDHAHTGFPEISFGRYASLLVEKGYKVARIEQVETPDMMEKRCKNTPRSTKYDRVVKREVCQVVSRGTRVPSVMDGEVKDEGPQYLYTITERELGGAGNRRVFGVSFVDVSVGVFHLSKFEDDRHSSRLRTLFAQYPPSQALIEKGHVTSNTYALLKSFVPSSLIDALVTGKEFWDASKTLNYLAESSFIQFSESSKLNWPDPIKPMLNEADSIGLTSKEEYEPCLSSLGGLIWYLKRCFIDEDLLSRKMFEVYHPPDVAADLDAAELPEMCSRGFQGRHMILDGNTLRNLEIFENSLDGSSKGTLFETLDHCSTLFGKRLLRQWICNPLRLRTAIDNRLDAIEDLRANHEVVAHIRPLLKSLPDLERLLSKIHSLGLKRSSDHPESRAIMFEHKQYSQRKVQDFLVALSGFQTSLEIINSFKDIQKALKSSLLRSCVSLETDGGKFPDFEDDLKYFFNAFDHSLAKKEGKIIPISGVDSEYDEAKLKIESINESLESYLVDQCKYFAAKVTYWGTDKKRFQLEVPDHAARRAGSEYHLTSQRKGFKRYWTGETQGFLEEMMSAEENRDAALQDIARRIFSHFGENHVKWRAAFECIAVLDVLLSFTEYSLDVDSTRPSVVEASADQKPFLRILDSRHPCSIQLFNNYDFIPNDVVMSDPESQESHSSLVLVTGPNMGGKSTLMRQTALICIMAQLGSYVPARECHLSALDWIFTRLGASDRIYEGESTFYVELAETASILQHATRNSLVIVDELGRGTATYDGTAIAHSVVRELTRIGSRTLFSTHYHSLVDEFASCEQVSLGHMACRVETECEDDPSQETVIFLYKFAKGACPKSYGFNAARLASLPEKVIKRASVKAKELELLNLKKRFFRKIFYDSPSDVSVTRQGIEDLRLIG